MKAWYSSNKAAYKSDKSKPDASRFYNSDGTLTRYAFACGYVETYLQGEKFIRLEYRSGGFFEVAFIKSESNSYTYNTFDCLANARAFVRHLCATL